jgi:WD40 repeat protein
LLAIANNLLGKVRLWNITSNREIAVLGHPWGGYLDEVHSVACSRDTLVAASPRAVGKWSLSGSGEKLNLVGHGRGTNSIVFSPDGKRVASAAKDRTVKIWDPATGQLLRQLLGFGAELETIAFSADGKILATGDWAGSIQMWDASTGKRLAIVPDHGLGNDIWSVAFSPDGRYFAATGGCASGRGDGGISGISLWQIQSTNTNEEAVEGPKLQSLPGPAVSGAGCIGFSPDSRLLAWVEGLTVHIWDLEESRERPFPPVRLAGFYRCLAFQPTGNEVIFVADTGVAEAWDATTGRKAYAFARQESQGGSEFAYNKCIVALSADGSRLAGVSSRHVIIWDTASRKILLRLPEEQSTIYSIAWSPNRERLAVGTGDGSLAIWDLAKVKAQLEEIGLGW